MIEEVSGALKERLGSSIVGTFTLSFMFLNWRFFTHIFSNQDVAAKIINAESALSSNLIVNLILSLCFALIVLFLVPFLKAKYDRYFFLKAAESELYRIRSERLIIGQLTDFNKLLSAIMQKRDALNAVLSIVQNGESTISTIKNTIQNRRGDGLTQIESLSGELESIRIKTQDIITQYDNLKVKFKDYEGMISSIEKTKK